MAGAALGLSLVAAGAVAVGTSPAWAGCPDGTLPVHDTDSESGEVVLRDEAVIAPDWALTGMPAYLDIQYTDLDGPPVLETSIRCRTRSVAARGSRSRRHTPSTGATGPTSVTYHPGSTGGPYPEGDIVHTYRHADDVHVDVTATWNGTWHVGDAGGDLPDIDLVETVELPVEELQSVRTSRY